MMVTQKVIVRVTSWKQVRIIGADPTEVSRAFRTLKHKWSQRRVVLTLSQNEEHPEWLEVSFPTIYMKDSDARARAEELQSDLIALFEQRT